MSDLPRKDLSTKAEEAFTSNSNKSGLDKAKESVTDGVDNVAGKAQSETGEKGYVQQAKDKVSEVLGK